jgi:hypothetical protein
MSFLRVIAPVKPALIHREDLSNVTRISMYHPNGVVHWLAMVCVLSVDCRSLLASLERDTPVEVRHCARLDRFPAGGMAEGVIERWVPGSLTRRTSIVHMPSPAVLNRPAARSEAGLSAHRAGV